MFSEGDKLLVILSEKHFSFRTVTGIRGSVKSMNIPISTGFLEKNIFKERVKQGHLDIITLSEVRERQTSYDITYMLNLKKMIQMNLF